MYIIYEPNKQKYMMQAHTRVLAFDDEKEAYWFIDQFYGFAMMQGISLSFQNPSLINEIQKSAKSIQVIELPKDFNKPVVNFKDIII